MDFLGSIKKLFAGRAPVQGSAEIDQLRAVFRERYHHFKLLLSANSRALEGMAEIEEAMRGSVPFGMGFVRSRVTRISSDVFNIVRHLNELAPGKYAVLRERFDRIQKQVNVFISPKQSSGDDAMVVPLGQIDRESVDLVGAKMANLGEMANQLHLDVPHGFVVTAAGYRRFMAHNDLQIEINRRIQAANPDRLDHLLSLSSAIQQLIVSVPLPEDLHQAISDSYLDLKEREGEDLSLAMRSSCLGEDLAGISFAGLYQTELNVHPDSIHQAYKAVVASNYNLQAISYRINRGISNEDAVMCVGCLKMVKAVSGGVLYSRNPVDIGDGHIIINSAWGLPKSVVDGNTTPDLFMLSRGNPPHLEKKEIAVKNLEFVCYPDEGVCRLDAIGDKGLEASLSDDEAIGLAQRAVELEDYYGVPLDIEWAIDENGRCNLLQCRPLQQISRNRGSCVKVDGNKILLSGGITASPGAASGPVFVLRKDADTLRFPRGAVLLVHQALPRWATLLSHAAAVVSEQGSVAGHLATVAREFGVPAIFGMHDACDSLQDGRVITVDADGKRICDGRDEALLEREATERNLMTGTPVFACLEDLYPHVVPLNLLDPDAPGFQAKNCRSYHDITRFCHEKSIQEMFQFGRDHYFPERSSKQLVCGIPMKWWVLNLDDGFRREVEGKSVEIENISSIPMLALWEGIAAKAWDGPPAVDGKGFLSVMFEATANPALVAGGHTRYADRNYFMISKNYCSLSSRLGFHFSTVEALVGDRISENYTSFQFKGGAANVQRRERRIVFITDLLEEHGFNVQAKQDHLIARMQNHDREHMLNCLKVLGYLIIHTRQLDMIMSNGAYVNQYRMRMRKDIRKMLSSK